MTTLSPPASGVTIRMYRQGLGDCFLLAFPTGQAGQAFYMLIDCGVIFGTQNPSQVMQAVATDIEAATGGDIHLLVATHEHWDHLSGFIQAGEIFQRMRIHNLWLAWTEDPSDKLAQQLRTEFQRDRQALQLAVNRARDAESVEPITNLLHFFGDPSVAPGNALDNSNTATTGAALNAIRAFVSKMDAAPEYRRPGEEPLSLPRASGLPEVSGVRIYVLGPPQDEKVLKDINPTVKGREVYTQGSALTARTAFYMALQDQAQVSPADQELRELSFPFDQRLRIPPAEAKQYEFFRIHYGFDESVPGEKAAQDGQQQNARQDDQAWRRIDDDWLGAAGDLALQLDSYTNNTSLALAIELVNTKKVLLFVADAQIGNWLSWDNLSWSVPDPTGAMQTIRIGDLLACTMLYKVGHHGSFNATVRGLSAVPKGLELMTSPDLVAMIPVNREMALKKRWDMPFDPLLQRLEEKTSHRVMRVDDAYPKQQPVGMSNAAWQSFKANFEETQLYMQYTVTD